VPASGCENQCEWMAEEKQVKYSTNNNKKKSKTIIFIEEKIVLFYFPDIQVWP